jgi:diguanylate cyclase (GGDEF)-like protein/PAS domain S-box-containing protein
MGDHGGHPVSVAGISRQLAECREKVRTLTESERGHRRFVESITEGYFFYRHDRDRVYQFLSPSVARVLGYSREEYPARYASMFTDAAMNADARGKTDLALAGKPQGTFEVEVVARDGAVHRLEITEYPVYDEGGRVTLIEGIAHDVTEKRKVEARLIELAALDDLTGLFNRRHFSLRLNEAIALARRHGFKVALAVVDIDGLKSVNDTHGHAAGDRMICAAADVLKRQFRKGDTVGRLDAITGRVGGDEFVIALPYSDAEGAKIAMDRVLQVIAGARVELAPGVVLSLQASAGVAELDAGLDGPELQARADAALYRAKREGRGRVWIWREDSVHDDASGTCP